MKVTLAADAIMYHVGLKSFLFIKRGRPPFRGMWAIPGGAVEKGERMHEAARREMEEETGIEFIRGCKFLSYYDAPDRDPRNRVISFVFMFNVDGNFKAGDDAAEIKAFNRNETRALINRDELAFDHGEIMLDALRHLFPTRTAYPV